MTSKLYPVIGLLLLWSIPSFSQVQINEYSVSNLNNFLDNFQKTEDWIELYNASNTPVDISGWHLSDKESKPGKWEIPAGTSIAANGYMLFWCSGRDEVVNNNYHTNFKLTQTKGDDVVLLSDASETVINVFPLGFTLTEHAHSRASDGSADWVICTNPSPNASNNNTDQFSRYTQAPSMSLEAGFYTATQTVSLTNNEPNSVLRYTTNGRNPSPSSAAYTTPITITATTVVKAQSFSNDPLILPGKMDFNTYFINEDFSLAVFSVAADEVINLANGNGTLIPIGSLEYFNVDKEREATSFGSLNRHGQDSWVLDHRSIDWVSRDEMGYSKAVEAPIFNYSDREEYQKFMFRNSGDDNYPAINDGNHDGSTHIRDEYVHTLAQEGGMKLDVRAVERVILFLNGEYWGVYGMRERPVDHDYTKEYYDQGKYDLHYLATWGGTEAQYGGEAAFNDWFELRDFILNNDMGNTANYEMVKDRMQVLSLIDYMIANLNVVASDWLNYNTGWWRGLDPDGNHKKWGYILWDLDATFDYYINYTGVPNTQPDAEPCDINVISQSMDNFFGPVSSDPNGYGNIGAHEKIFLKLQQENAAFKQLYYSRQADLMNTVYSCENMIALLDRMLAVIEPEMPRQIARWGGTMTEWQSNVDDLKDFINQRCMLLDDGMVDCFDLTGPYPLTLMVEPAGVGKIDLNTLDLEAFPWTGNYFGGMENRIKAKATDNDYEFLYWESKSGNVIFPDANEREATITLTQMDTLVAVFGLPTSSKELSSNFSFNLSPNPTQQYLNLAYELDDAAEVSIGLYSVLGQKISDFPTAGGKRQRGKHQAQLNLGESIPTGLYFVHFKAGEKEKTRRISIIR